MDLIAEALQDLSAAPVQGKPPVEITRTHDGSNTGRDGDAPENSTETESTNGLQPEASDSRGDGQNGADSKDNNLTASVVNSPEPAPPLSELTPETNTNGAQSPMLGDTSKDVGEPATGFDSVVPHETSVVSPLTNESDEIPGGRPTLAKMLGTVKDFFEQYVNFPMEGQSLVLTLWSAYTYVYPTFDLAPYLHIFSPEANCGKSTVLDCLELMVVRPMKFSNTSLAAFFREVDRLHPTLLWDEVDNIFADERNNKEIIGMINDGYKVGAKVIRCSDMGRGVERFDVYCPKAFTGIGKIPRSLQSRSIDIRMERQEASHKAKKFRLAKATEFAGPIQKELEQVMAAHAQAIKDIDEPEMPEAIDDGRIEDIIQPLLTVATVAGPDWLALAQDALTRIFATDTDLSKGVQLLYDCRAIFLNRQTDKMTTQELLNDLIDTEGANSPWPVMWEGDVKFGKIRGPAKKLAELLAAFGIIARTVRHGDERAKGYLKADFAEAWSRYLPELGKMVNAELELEL